MITSKPFGSTWLISLASGMRAGAVAAAFGLVVVGLVVWRCGTAPNRSVEGVSKQNRSRVTRKLRFTYINPSSQLPFDSIAHQIDVEVSLPKGNSQIGVRRGQN
jgi:hypothetical protein